MKTKPTVGKKGKITPKQQQEIDFLCKYFKAGNPIKEQQEEYINVTVLGNGSGKVSSLDNGTKNPLLIAKRNLDINIKMWREDLTTGMLGADELKEDFNCEYGNKLVDSILKGVTKEYRAKVLKMDRPHTLLAFANFKNLFPTEIKK